LLPIDLYYFAFFIHHIGIATTILSEGNRPPLQAKTPHSAHSRQSETFVALERNRFYRNKLAKLLIPAEQFSQIRFDLDRCGINASSLFPDLEGLCRDIEWQHSLLDDEPDQRKLPV